MGNRDCGQGGGAGSGGGAGDLREAGFGDGRETGGRGRGGGNRDKGRRQIEIPKIKGGGLIRGWQRGGGSRARVVEEEVVVEAQQT